MCHKTKSNQTKPLLFYKVGFSIKYPSTVNIPLNKETETNHFYSFFFYSYSFSSSSDFSPFRCPAVLFYPSLDISVGVSLINGLVLM